MPTLKQNRSKGQERDALIAALQATEKQRDVAIEKCYDRLIHCPSDGSSFSAYEVDEMRRQLTIAQNGGGTNADKIEPSALAVLVRERDDELRALKHTIVSTIGGKDYEGFPTSEFNYLQRLRILIEKESLLGESRTALNALLRFTQEICGDIRVSQHYPSMDQARTILKKINELP